MGCGCGAPKKKKAKKPTEPLKNAFYAQSGGVTAVINASACGVIENARKNKNKICTVFRKKAILADSSA